MRRAFTLTELVVAMGLMALFFLIFLTVATSASRTMRTIEERSQAQKRARLALNYIRDRVRQAARLDPGWQEVNLYAGRNHPLFELCDRNQEANLRFPDLYAPAPDNRVTTADSVYREDVSPYRRRGIANPLCLGMPSYPLQIPVNGAPPPEASGGVWILNRNPDQRYPTRNIDPPDADALLRAIYRTELEDLNGDGAFLPIERRLRTLVFVVDHPSTRYVGPSPCPSDPGPLAERQVVAIAHTWKEKMFWTDRNGNAQIDPGEWTTRSYVLYEHRYRIFEDPARRLDPNCDGVWDERDEVARVMELPIADGIVDVLFELLTDEGSHPIAPCVGNCPMPPELASVFWMGRQHDLNGQYFCYYRIREDGLVIEPNVGTYFADWNPVCGRVDAVRVTVVAGTDTQIRLLEKTKDASGILFRALNAVDPRAIGELDYLGVTPYRNFYKPGALITLQETIPIGGR